MACIGDVVKSPNDTNVTNDNDNNDNTQPTVASPQNRNNPNHNNKPRNKKRRRRGDDNNITGIGVNALRTNPNKKPTKLPPLRQKNKSYASAAKWESVQIYGADDGNKSR
eukprot:6927_1